MEQLELLLTERESPKQDSQKQNIIPRMTEDPAATGKMCDRWIRDFHKKNGMRLPKGYYSKTTRQKRGMFYGMLRTYGISLDDTITD